MPPDAKLRTTASSHIVAPKSSLNTVGPKRKKNQGSKVPHSEPAAHGGLSAEDDTLEKEMAMSSPMKGGELRATKVWLLFSVLIVMVSFRFSLWSRSRPNNWTPSLVSEHRFKTCQKAPTRILHGHDWSYQTSSMLFSQANNLGSLLMISLLQNCNQSGIMSMV
jgi:hypothetical protein